MSAPSPRPPDRFRPHAHREMASMFDDVSGRYDLLNRVMTLGQDDWWRTVMWRSIPADARVVVDLCTGSGVSLPGLQRTGRTLIGVDVSLGMLRHAQDEHGGPGWSPRVVCADGFHLPFRDGSVDAITVAFGVRNLRPRERAMREIARVLRPGGVLAVLEAAAPAPGPLRPFHAFWVRHVVPFAGRLSPDPSAYRYLSESIFEFGSGPEFEADLGAAGFGVTGRRSFLLGATRLWVASRGGSPGQNPADAVHAARSGAVRSGGIPQERDPRDEERRTWEGVQAAVSVALVAALGWSLVVWHKLNAELPLADWQRSAGWVLIVLGLAVFALRAAVQVVRFRDR